MLRQLKTRTQRLLFVVGALGLLPWLLLRVVAGIWRVNGLKRYLEYAFVEPIAPWFESGWWWYTQLEWHDWPVLPGAAVILLAFAWPYGPAKASAWVKGSGR